MCTIFHTDLPVIRLKAVLCSIFHTELSGIRIKEQLCTNFHTELSVNPQKSAIVYDFSYRVIDLTKSKSQGQNPWLSS